MGYHMILYQVQYILKVNTTSKVRYPCLYLYPSLPPALEYPDYDAYLALTVINVFSKIWGYRNVNYWQILGERTSRQIVS